MSENPTRDGLNELDERLGRRKFLFRAVLMALVGFMAWKLGRTPMDLWRPVAGGLGLAGAFLLHFLFYKVIAPWIAKFPEDAKRNQWGLFSSWVYLFFLVGPILIGAGTQDLQWFRMGFVTGFALVFSVYGTYFEVARRTWMKA